MNRPRICAVIVSQDPAAVKKVEPLVDLFEVRIDLVGNGWQEVAKQLNQPWIACNRRADEGGSWERSEAGRVEELLKAAELGADIVDLELSTEGLAQTIPLIKPRSKCLLSCHYVNGTPPYKELRETVQRQLSAGADICKVVTTAHSFEDNITVLQLIPEFPSARVVAFAMGQSGLVSRVLCPVVGGDFTYASTEKGAESAAGQITAVGLRKIYEMLKC